MSFDEVKPTQHADVAIHCGDLTEESKIEEFRTTLQLLKNIDAPLKLVIAGNHDFTMDIPAYKKKVAELEARESVEPELLRKVYGDYGEARRLFEEAKAEGITFLDEGTHRFRLQNNALLTVYASPYTPAFGDWGFQYPPVEGRDFSIEKGVDVVLTHGPPQGILDRTDNKRAGCSDLFQAVARARPRLHCFGHIHVGWGAKLVTWRDQPSEKPSHFTDIDNDKSALIENLSGLRGSKFDTPEILEEKSKKLKRYEGERCRTTSHGRADPNPLHFGSQTLFVNAAIEGPSDERPVQLPWLVDIELPSC
ncbi:hypothetical protein FQN54_001218 [Arachnomyces sp. PD_36]|nr:hypothetical protein FQN54_001218 [Arachnomyces sp. PD_36]